jgi:CheY-like chemotaxis protein
MVAARAPFTVVIVEDDPMLRHLLVRLLDRHGCWTVALESAVEALNLLEHTHADLVVTDWRMASMDGVQLAHRVRSIWPDLPVIIMSGAVLDPYALDVPDGTWFLPKPFGPEELSQAIERALAPADPHSVLSGA